jgi:hypothetical protein
MIRQALCESMIGDDTLYQDVAGTVFLGTPHRGIELANSIQLLTNVPIAIGVGSRSPMMKQLMPNSEALQTLNMQFRRVLQRAPTRICSGFETQKTNVINQLVSGVMTGWSGTHAELSIDCRRGRCHFWARRRNTASP